MEVVYFSSYIITIKYKKFKMINLIYMISILNFFHYVICDEMNKIRSHLYMILRIFKLI
jgi:hypothetical protein